MKLGKYGMGMFWNILGIVLPVLVSVVSIPTLIKLLGVEKFGVLTLLWSIVGYFSLFDFGMGRAITQRIASLAGDKTLISSVFVFGLVITGITGAIGLLLQSLNTSFILEKFFAVSQSIKTDTAQALLISAFAIPATTISSGYRGLLEGLEDFQTSNAIKILLGVIITLFPLLTALFVSKDLSALAVAIVFARLLVLLIYIVVASRYNIRYNFSVAALKPNMDMLHFGIWMTVSNIISPILVNVDKFIVSGALGAALVAYYTVPAETITKLLLISGAIGTSLLPRQSQLRLIDPVQERQVYKNTFLLNFKILSVMCLLALLLAKFAIGAFLGPEFLRKSLAVTLFLIVGVWINGMAYMPYSALHAHGLTRLTAITHGLELVLYIPLAWYMVHAFGLVGAAIAWTFRVGVDYGMLTYFYKRHVETK